MIYGKACYVDLLLSRLKLSTIVQDNCKVSPENHDLQLLLDRTTYWAIHSM